MMQFLIQLNPTVLAILLSLALAARAATDWRWGMLLDVAFIAMYWRYPTLGTAALAVAQHVVRYAPPLAGEVALITSAGDAIGLTRWFWALMLPGIVQVSRPPRTSAAERIDRVERPDTEPQMVASGPTITIGAIGSSTSEPSLDQVLMMNEWLKILNNDATAPHLGIIGPSGQGKTTLAMVVLYYRQSSLVVTTAKGRAFDPWGGMDVIRPEMDLAAAAISWTKIGRAIESVYFEMLRRNTLPHAETEQITLVIDELPTVFGKLPHVVDKVIDMWRMGRAAGIRVVGTATDITGRGWKIEGQRDVIDNLVFAKVEDGRKWSVGRIDPNGRLINPRRMDTRQLAGIAERVDFSARIWAGLYTSSVWTGGEGAKATTTPPTAAAQTPDGKADRRAPTQLLDALIREGLERDAAAERLHAQGYGLDNTRFAARRAALGVKARGRPRRGQTKTRPDA